MDGHLGQTRQIGREAHTELLQVWQSIGGEVLGQQHGQLRLTSTLVSDTKQLDHEFAGATFGQPLAQIIEHVAVRLARPELISINQIQQRHRLATQRMDDVAIIDHMPVFSVPAGPAAGKTQHARAADEQFHPIIEHVCPQPVTD